jgi:hypothetical protein
MKYEISSESVKVVFEENDYQRKLASRVRKEDFTMGGTLICSKPGECRFIPDQPIDAETEK